MGFFLLGRDRDSGELTLLNSDLIETREAALARLSVIVAAPEVRSRQLDYFIADFAGAYPVLLVIPTQPETAPEEGDVGVWEAPVTYDKSDAVLDEILSEAISEVPEVAEVPEPEVADVPEPEVADVPEPEVADVPEPEVADVPEPEVAEVVGNREDESTTDVSLAEALKRAADTLESEGIQAPASVGLAAPEPWPWEAGREEVSSPTLIDSEESESEYHSGQPVVEETLDIQLDALEEPSVDGDPLLPSPLEDEDLLPPRPVIMGDYPETHPNPISSEPEILAETCSSEGAPQLIETVPESPHPVSVLDDLTIVVPDAGAPAGPPTDSDGRVLTCDDCVYISTCPNKDESSPDDCGNFQWKSG